MKDKFPPKKSLMLYMDYEELLTALSDEQVGKLIKALFYFQRTRQNPELDQVLSLVFIQLKQNLLRDIGKYESICERNRGNGLKGGRPKNPENPVGYLGTQRNPEEPKKPDMDMEMDKGMDIKEDLVKKPDSETTFLEENGASVSSTFKGLPLEEQEDAWELADKLTEKKIEQERKANAK